MSEIKLWDHQKNCLDKMKDKNAFLIAAAPGTGKTVIMIKQLEKIYAEEGCLEPTLILCPKIVIQQWKKEIARFSTIPESKIAALLGDSVRKLKTLQRYARDSIFITNYESLQSDKIFSYFQKLGLKVLILDEIHFLKSHAALRTKRTDKLALGVKYKYGMSGTPILKDILDLFSPMKILNPDILGSSFIEFRLKYMFDANAGMPGHVYFPNWKPLPGALEKIKERIYPHSFSVSIDEALDLPPILTKNVYFELTPLQRVPYDELEEDFVTYIDGEELSVSMALTKILRLYQLCTGIYPLQDGSIKCFEKNPRAEALADLLESNPNSKIIVWCCFIHNYNQVKAVCDSLKIKSIIASSEFTGEDPVKSIDKFKKDNDVRVLIANPQSSGTGLNLPEADVAIFYSRNYSLGNYIQALGRNIRGDSKKYGHSRILCINMIAQDTIDEIIQETIDNKGQLNREILRAMRDRFKVAK